MAVAVGIPGAASNVSVAPLLEKLLETDTTSHWATAAAAARKAMYQPPMALLLLEAIGHLDRINALTGSQAPTNESAQLTYLLAFAAADRMLSHHRKLTESKGADANTSTPSVPDQPDRLRRAVHAAHSAQSPLSVRRGVDGRAEPLNVAPDLEPLVLGEIDASTAARSAVSAAATRDTLLGIPGANGHPGQMPSAERLSDNMLLTVLSAFERRTGTPVLLLWRKPAKEGDRSAVSQVQNELAGLGVRSCEVFEAPVNDPEWNEIRSWFTAVFEPLLAAVDRVIRPSPLDPIERNDQAD
jgi:hypothetical protein